MSQDASLVGELQGWSPTPFNRGAKPFSPSLVGIVWLVPQSAVVLVSLVVSAAPLQG